MFHYVKEIEEKYNICFNSYNNNNIIRIFNGNILNEDNKNGENLNIIGIYYYYVKFKYKKAKKYFIKSIKLGCNKAYNNLGNYYKDKYKYNTAIKYYLISYSYNTNCIASIKNLARCYLAINKYDLAEKYYLISVNTKNILVLEEIGNFYLYYKNNYKLAEKYYLQFYNSNYDIIIASELLFKFYKIINNYELAIKFYIIAINNGFNKKKQYFDKLILYHYLGEKYYENIKSINIYKNKVNLLYKNDDCPICLDNNVKCISLECCHFYCTNCYVKVYIEKKCPICKMEF